MNRKVYVLLAILFSMIVGVIAYWQFAKLSNKNVEDVQIYVAAQPIKALTPITGKDLKPVILHLSKLDKEGLANNKAILEKVESSPIGKIPEVDISTDNIIYQDHFIPESFSSKIKPGYRAMAIGINQVTGVSGHLLENDKVDVMVTEESSSLDALPIQETVAKNVMVLSVDEKAVVLEVLPETALKLTEPAIKGTAILSLKSPKETD